MVTIRHILFTLFAVLAFTLEVSGRDTTVKHYNVSTGLSGDRIFSLAQDSLGFIWCASHWGIDRLDGRSVKTYYPQHNGETVNLYSHQTRICTSGKYVYVATQNGFIFRFDPYSDSFKEVVDLSETISDREFVQNDLFIDNRGDLYMATSDGLYKYSAKRGIETIDDSHPVTGIIGDGNGTVYYAVKNILCCYSSGISQPAVQCDESIKTLHYMGRRVYIGTYGGSLYIYDENADELIKSKALDRKVHITSISNGRPGELLIGTDGAGCHVYDIHADSIVRTFSNTSGTNDDGLSISGNSVMDVLSDRDDNVWIATFSGAISMIPSGRSHCRVIYPPSAANISNAMMVQRNGTVCYASDDGVYTYEPTLNKWHLYAATMSPKGPILNLDEDKEGNLWAGGFGCGILKINPLSGEANQYTKDKPLFGTPLNSDYIASLTVHGNKLWLGSYSDGKLMEYDLDSKQVKTYNIPDVHSITIIEDNIVVCGQSIQFTLLNPMTGEVKVVPTNVAINDILSVNGTIWLATSGKGILTYDVKADILADLSSNIPEMRYIMAMEYSGNDNVVYLTTQKQFYKVDVNSGKVSDVGRIAGLSPMTFNERAMCMLSPTRLLLGSSRYAMEVDISNDISKRNIPYIYFSDLKVAYSEIAPKDDNTILPASLDCIDRLDLPYGQNSFSIGFSMVDFRESSFLEFEYRLTPFEDEWISETDYRASYTNVPSGKYVFQLRLKDNRTDEIVAQKDLSIHIDGPVWTKPWMYVIYLIIAILLGWLIIRLVKSRLKQSYSEEKMKLFTEMAHELRTPVALIKAPLSELADNKSLSDENRATLEIAIRNTDRLHELTTQLMDFQKADANAMILNSSTVDIHEFITMRLGPWEYRAKQKGLDFCTDIERLHGVVTAVDMSKMEAILTNLLSNAIKYTDNGTVTVKGWQEDDFYCISVSDTGIGIPANELKHLFRQFFRARNARKSQVGGTGIGLMLTHKLVELHRGEITVSSKEGTGSSFTLKFPIRQEESVETNSNDETLSSLHDETVMIIDDNNDMRDVLKKSLEQSYNVMTAKDGVEAIDLIKENMPDIIVSDLMMPRMNGEELCRNLKNNVETSHIPFILLTAVSDRTTKASAFECGADDYITKPFDNTELKARIRIHLRHSRKLKESLQSTDTSTDEADFINPLDREFMEKLTSLIDKNIDNPDYSVSIMSSDMAMSRATLYNKLKAVAGQSPNDFIRLQRLKKAAELLKQNRYTIAEVAVMTGFSDTKYFATVFKRQFGSTPSSYGKQSKQL